MQIAHAVKNRPARGSQNRAQKGKNRPVRSSQRAHYSQLNNINNASRTYLNDL